jgi:spore coat polysaccharide biosynthesis protein SpsF
LKSISCIDEVVLGISEGIENEIYIKIARENKIKYIIGDEEDVLSRLIDCGICSNATDIFRVTSESPFLFFEPVEELWSNHIKNKLDATFYDDVVDGSGFEILSLEALQKSHLMGDDKHRSELCTLYIRENLNQFKVDKPIPPKELVRKDLRLTVDNPEDLVVCRKLYSKFKHLSPRIPVLELVKFLDKNPSLKELVYPLTESGYQTMYL